MLTALKTIIRPTLGAYRKAGQRLMFSSLIENLRKTGPIDDTDKLFTVASRGNFGVISPIQARNELVPVLDIVKQRRPKTVLEIGTASGGTLFMLTRVAAPDALIISLDLPDGPFGGGYSEERIPLYEAFALPTQTMRLLRANSHDSSSLDAVREALGGKTIDLLFIDGDHTYEGVRQDYEMYSRLSSADGVIGFHDIVYAPGVDKFWKELKAAQPDKCREFISQDGSVFGIGLLDKRGA